MRVFDKVRNLAAPAFRVGRPELFTLLLVALVAGGTWLFVEIAEEVEEQETRSFDERVLLALRNPENVNDPLGPRWMEETARDFTSLGGIGVLAAISAAAIGYMLLDRKKHLALLTAIAVAGGFALSFLLKSHFERPRPQLVMHGAYVVTSSFPSGHSMMSAVTFLTLGALLARAQPKRRLKAYIISVALLFTIIVGVSRVYLGVHWPTDVLAGWTVGAVWATLCWLVARLLQSRGKVESE